MTAAHGGPGRPPPPTSGDNGHFPSSLLYAAAKMYYDEDATQVEVARKLNTSRATVSRLLAQARARGIVRIEVVEPDHTDHEVLAAELCRVLGLRAAHISAPMLAVGETRSVEDVMGRVLAPAVGRALSGAGLVRGDVLLVSSGRTVYEVARFALPDLPGVLVAPTVGGTDQPEGWYQTNEIARHVAERIGGRATYLFAPALPGPELFAVLQHDPAIQRVLQLWPNARCVLTGVGAPPTLRQQAPQFVDVYSAALAEAVGDVCSRFFTSDGEPVHFPGSERLIAVELELLRQIPVVIAVAAGREKVAPIRAAARAGYFNELVTDPQTAEELIALG
ncbi:MAG: polymerase sigma 70 [Friedmanniella sp.]|nr:polymerase sigma 70 [Friedmanniella sp.]